MDTPVGEAFTLVEAMSLATRKKWNQVEFECDSLVLCSDVLFANPPHCWAISTMVEHIRATLADSMEWKVI